MTNLKILAVKLVFTVMMLGISINTIYANNIDTLNGRAELTHMPWVYINGYGGYSSGGLYMGTGELLQPLLLRDDRNLYVYGEGRFSNTTDTAGANSPWSGALGLGYRQVWSQSWVLGGYLLGGYSKTPTGHGVLYANPGLEALGEVWDFRVNGYIPVSKREWNTEGWADEFGNNNYIIYHGHDQYDAWFVYHETAGIGGDAQVGRNLFTIKNTLVRGYLDGYYFSEASNDAVVGGGAKITVQPNAYLKFSLSDNYDSSAHNVVMLGVQISLYDLIVNNNEPANIGQDVQHRLFEPIDHNYAATGSGNVLPTAGGPGRGNPDVTQYGPAVPWTPVNPPTPPPVDPWNGHHVPERTNVWFFQGGSSGLASSNLGGLDDGTYEHPFSGSEFNQAELNTIAAGLNANAAYIYVTSGTYNAFTNTNGKYQPLEIPSGESLWGRKGDHEGFGEPASYANRPVFKGGLKLDSNTSIHDLILQNSAEAHFDTGIMLNKATDVSINNSKIGVDVPGDAGYHTGVSMENSSFLTINASNVYGYNDLNTGDEKSYGVGLKVINGGDVTAINDSQIKGTSVNSGGMGIFVAPGPDGNATMGNIVGDGTATFSGLGFSHKGNGSGVFVWSNDLGVARVGDISGSRFLGEGVNAYGFYAHSHSLCAAKITVGDITDSIFEGAGSDVGYGFVADSRTDWVAQALVRIGNISGSQFTGIGARQGYGFYAHSHSGMGATEIQMHNISDSKFSGTGVTAFGFYAANAKPGPYNSFPSLITIGNISGSKFSAQGSSYSTGFFTDHDIMGGHASTTIGHVLNSTFVAVTSTKPNAGVALFLDAESIKVNDVTYNNSNISDLVNYLGKNVTGRVCVDLTCVPGLE